MLSAKDLCKPGTPTISDQDVNLFIRFTQKTAEKVCRLNRHPQAAQRCSKIGQTTYSAEAVTSASAIKIQFYRHRTV